MELKPRQHSWKSQLYTLFLKKKKKKGKKKPHFFKKYIA